MKQLQQQQQQQQQPAELQNSGSVRQQQPVELQNSRQPAEPQEDHHSSSTSAKSHVGTYCKAAQETQLSGSKRAVEKQHGSIGTTQEQWPPQPETPSSRIVHQHGSTRHGSMRHSS